MKKNGQAVFENNTMNSVLTSLWLSLSPVRCGQVFLFEKNRIEQLRLIALATVAQDRDDGMAGAEFLREADSAGHVDAGGAAQAQAFILQQAEHDRQSFFIRYLERYVHLGLGHVGGDASLADALGDGTARTRKFAGLVITLHRHAHRVSQLRFYVRVLFLQIG